EAYGIYVVENLGPVMLDLRQQDGFERSVGSQSVLRRPLPLQHLIVAVGKKGTLVTIEHGLQEVKGAEPVVQEYTTPLFKPRHPSCKLVQPRQIRRIQTTILEETHEPHEPRYFR